MSADAVDPDLWRTAVAIAVLRSRGHDAEADQLIAEVTAEGSAEALFAVYAWLVLGLAGDLTKLTGAALEADLVAAGLKLRDPRA